jgi:hypothetical protein
MRLAVSPFLVPSDQAVEHSGWRLSVAEGDVALPGELPHWDYLTLLELSASVVIHRSTVLADCELDGESELSVLVTARSDHTATERRIALAVVPIQDPFDLWIRCSLPGFDLGGRLSLSTHLVATRPVPLTADAPQRPGSILWSEIHHCHLEGSGSQFPTDTADFSGRAHGQDAGWELVVDLTDPEARFTAAARLTLNTGNAKVREMVSGTGSESATAMSDILRWDVTRQMVYLAIASDEVLEAEFDPHDTSVVGILRNLLSAVWPLDDPHVIRTWSLNSPDRIERDLQHYCGVFR